MDQPSPPADPLLDRWVVVVEKVGSTLSFLGKIGGGVVFPPKVSRAEDSHPRAQRDNALAATALVVKESSL